MANGEKLKQMNKIVRPWEDLEAVTEKAWELLDAMRQAEFAQGAEEKQDSRQDCTQAAENLRALLSEIEDRT